MGRTRIKICGITSADDGRLAVEAGADAIGLVFHPDSPRAVSVGQAAGICAELPAFVSAVGLFVDPDGKQVTNALSGCPLDILQFHGHESPEFCAGFGRRYLKAVRMGTGTDLENLAARYGGRRLLLDAYVPGQAGGTGETFRWSLIPGDLAPEMVLAGGLTPANVVEAVRTVRPFALDVSSGVEERHGVKSAERLEAFVQGVRDADNR
ncbi:phosphoribosylanthranilate isomerase [Thiohalorhabdus sp.]|uniref:phosphoribosylanthranilate isomerase n=1 Tax=Thiohalorhabdus sp. TaxID=3094134 RepID=UPI002FC363E2